MPKTPSAKTRPAGRRNPAQTARTRATPENRLKALQLELPPAPAPKGVYQPLLVVGKLAYLSGHGPLQADGTLLTGKVGADLDQAQGTAAARQTGLTILATLRRVLGSLDKVERVIKTFGLVNCTPDFSEHPKVINGCSELFVELWGDSKGIGARSAVGTNSLPGNIPVEIEMVFLLK